MKEEKTIQQLLEMLDNPEAYTDQEIRDIINQDEETREAYRLMVEAKRSSRHTHANNLTNVDAAWKRFNQKRNKLRQPSQHWWMRVAAILIAAAFLCGLSYAAYHAISAKQESERYTNEKMLALTENGEKVIVTWLKGTWVEKDNGSYIEDYPIVRSPALPLNGEYRATVKVDGKEIESGNLPDLPASSVNKVEIHFSKGKTVNLITTPVQVPSNMKGNVNPNLTILLTGTVPKGAYQPVTIWKCKEIKDSYDWHDYIYTSWTGKWENVRIHLKEVAYRKDHHVRVNICKGVPQQHIDRIKKLMQENGVTNYELVKQ
ncbi:MAG: hypothetical protein IKO73_09155 [Bacteroidaceae bacterium]|nr:hypothetical protein [Bacteroidaceae bacterium]